MEKRQVDMRILIVSQYFYPETFRINDICAELVSTGHEVTVYCGLPNYLLGKFFPGYSFLGPYNEDYKGVNVIRSPLIPRGKKVGLRLILNYLSFAILGSILAPFLVRGKYDRIFVYGLSPVTLAIPGIVLKKVFKIPMVMWVTDLWPESLSATGVIKNSKIINLVGKLVSWIYSFMDTIYVSSKGFVDPISRLGVSKDKIKYWPYWAEEIFEEHEKEKSVESSDNEFKILFAGNIGVAQDFETIVGASMILKESHSEVPIKFIILGDGQKKAWLEKEVESKDLSRYFSILGRRPLEEMPLYFQKADVLLVILKDEEIFSLTIPSKVQSYLASGKPILSSVRGETSRIIESWNAGVSSSAGDPEDLAKNIIKMSQMSDSELSNLGANGLSCYRSEFNKEQLLKSLVDDLSSLEVEKV